MPFSTIVGHGRLRALLSRAVAQNTLPPSLLLSGPKGVGKRRLALAVAEALNCLDLRAGVSEVSGVAGASGAEGTDACGSCAACRRIARMVHPDVIVLAPDDKGSISIESVRSVIERSGYRPFEGRRRVVIIDDAEALTAPAQSALLKTLEEPPAGSVFILVSSMPDALLATVRSRGRRRARARRRPWLCAGRRPSRRRGRGR
jgi:DNA polymerase III subunit delta'